jgi:hypothetical protein
MKKLLTVIFCVFSLAAGAQCDIIQRVSPDGSMLYYMEPVQFYWTKAKELKGNVVTDKENYFLSLQPRPFPDKAQSKKIKNDLELKLADGKTYRLSHFDTHYTDNDSIMEVLFLIEEKDVQALTDFPAEEVNITMGGEEGVRKYVFKLHKQALQEQLRCYFEEKKKK